MLRIYTKISTTTTTTKSKKNENPDSIMLLIKTNACKKLNIYTSSFFIINEKILDIKF